MNTKIFIAANNGDIGGGEVMQVAIAKALSALGKEICILSPENPSGLATLGRREGFQVEVLPASGRKSYMASLAKWRLGNPLVPLWCNGLVPSLATAGVGPRLVHLHRVPEGAQKTAAFVAKVGATSVLVPSHYMRSRLGVATRVLENWTEDIPFVEKAHGFPDKEVIRVGFLGRLTHDKGVHVLSRAIDILNSSHLYREKKYRLVLGGESRFESKREQIIVEEELSRISGVTTRLGWVEKKELFSKVDLAVFPSSFDEPFGLVAAEAMGYGIPFVISTAGGLPEVAGKDHPWIFEKDNAEALAECISSLVAYEDGKNVYKARQRWEKKYSPEAGKRRVEVLLEELGAGL